MLRSTFISVVAATCFIAVGGCERDAARVPTAEPPPANGAAPAAADDPLPSWNDGAAKQAIETFVARVTTDGGAEFVPPNERIAVFDNDGTLWSEQPLYFQLAFALDRVRELAPEHPDWRERQPFKAVLEGNVREALAGGERGVVGAHGRHARRQHDRGIRRDRP